MMHEEFEKMAGYRIAYKYYHEIVEPMYMASDLSKQEFIALVNFRDYATLKEKQIVEQMRQIAGVMHDSDETFNETYLARLNNLLDSLKDVRGFDNEPMYPNAKYKWGLHGDHPFPAHLDLHGDHVEMWSLT